MLLETIHVFHILFQIFVDFHSGSAKSCNSRYIVCSGTHSALLSSAKDLRLDFCFFINIKKSHALWSVNLMTADRKKIDSHFFWVDPVFSKGLYGIHMKQSPGTFFVDKGRDLLHRHHSAHFIIYIHHRYQNGIFSEYGFQSIHFYHTTAVHRKVGYLKALFLKKKRRLAYCRMLH